MDETGNAHSSHAARTMSDPLSSDKSQGSSPVASRPSQALLWLGLIGLVVAAVVLSQRGRDSHDRRAPPAATASQGVKPEPELPKDLVFRRALDKRIDVDFEERPLDKCIADIAEQIGFQAYIDRPALTDEGVAVDTPITMHLEDISARAALQLLLESMVLDYWFREGVLVITVPERVKRELATRAYDVTDLVVVSTAGKPAEADFAPLIELIRSSFDAFGWERAKPPRGIEGFSANGVNSLVIRQSLHNHDYIRALLDELKSERHAEMAAVKERARSAKTDPALDSAKLGLPAGSTSRFAAVVRGNNAFALELYRELARTTRGNVVFSPYSVSAAAAMACDGARQKTAAEIAATMHFLPWQERLPAVFRDLSAIVTQPLSGRSARMPAAGVTIVNRLWLQQELDLEEPFRQTLRRDYNVEPVLVDFAHPANLVQDINRRLADDTSGLVKDAVSADQFSSQTRFLLTNAVAFVAPWLRPFRVALTSPGVFELADGWCDVQYMNLRDECGYAVLDDESPRLKVLENPYGKGELSMVILLPADDLSKLEDHLSEQRLSQWLAVVEQRRVEVFLPRFRIEWGAELRPSLQSLGIRAAFSSEHADFSGICTQERLCLSNVIQKAVIDVNEEGTRAGAVSEIQGYFGGHDAVFQANRPFLFLIRDNRTGTILFLGRLVDPRG